MRRSYLIVRPLGEGFDVDSLDADYSADLVSGQLTRVENPVQPRYRDAKSLGERRHAKPLLAGGVRHGSGS